MRFLRLAVVALILLVLVSPARSEEQNKEVKGKEGAEAQKEKAKAATPAPPEAHVANIRVLILPFDIEGRMDLSPLRRNVMESLAGELHSAGAEITGTDVIKDLVLKGRVVKFDEAEAYRVAEKARRILPS